MKFAFILFFFFATSFGAHLTNKADDKSSLNSTIESENFVATSSESEQENKTTIEKVEQLYSDVASTLQKELSSLNFFDRQKENNLKNDSSSILDNKENENTSNQTESTTMSFLEKWYSNIGLAFQNTIGSLSCFQRQKIEKFYVKADKREVLRSDESLDEIDLDDDDNKIFSKKQKANTTTEFTNWYTEFKLAFQNALNDLGCYKRPKQEKREILRSDESEKSDTPSEFEEIDDPPFSYTPSKTKLDKAIDWIKSQLSSIAQACERMNCFDIHDIRAPERRISLGKRETTADSTTTTYCFENFKKILIEMVDRYVKSRQNGNRYVNRFDRY